MAVTTTSFTTATTYKITINTDADTGVSNAGQADVTGTSSTIYAIEIHNAAASIVYLKFYDAQEITVGTTAPVMTFMCAATTRFNVFIPGGYSFASGISMAGDTAGGGTAGTSDPASAVTVHLTHS